MTTKKFHSQFGNEILHVHIFLVIHCQQFRVEMRLHYKSGDLKVFSWLYYGIRGGTTYKEFVLVQSLICVRLFATPLTPTCQASLSFTISQSFIKHYKILMSKCLLCDQNYKVDI